MAEANRALREGDGGLRRILLSWDAAPMRWGRDPSPTGSGCIAGLHCRGVLAAVQKLEDIHASPLWQLKAQVDSGGKGRDLSNGPAAPRTLVATNFVPCADDHRNACEIQSWHWPRLRIRNAGRLRHDSL